MRLPPALPLSELLRQTQDSQSRLMAHQHLGLAEIQQAAGCGRAVRHAGGVRELSGRPRRPGGATAGRPAARPRSSGHDATHYPLSLMVRPGERAAAAARLPARPVRSGRALRRWGSGWCGCWRRRCLIRSGRSARSTSCRGRSGGASCRVWNATARAVPLGDPAGAVCGAGRAHAGCGCGGVRGPRAELRRARRARQPAGASSARARASAPRRWWGCAWSARPRWWSGCSASSRPAAPICRSIPTTRRSGWRSCWPMPGCAVLVTQARALALRPAAGDAARPSRRAAVRLDADWPRDRAAAATAPPLALDPAPPRLCHLHLRLNRNPKGRRGRRTAP